MKRSSPLSIGLLLLTLHIANAQQFIPEGRWRGIFQANDGTEIPINFEVKGKSADKATLYLLNADERFEIKRLRQVKDSLFVYFDDFDNEFALKINKDGISGILRKQATWQQSKPSAGATPQVLNVPFSAQPGIAYRFSPGGATATGDLTGKWDVTFIDNDGKESKGLGVFKQTGNKLSGTFLRTTGDSRYLEGIVEGNTFKLSGFIGSGPSLTTGTIEGNTISGFSGGATSKSKFTGIKNDAAALPDAYTLTTLKEGTKDFDFSFPDINGNTISLKDPKYKNKVVLVTISGTWCPNCVDEANFLAPWYEKNKARGVEAITIFYERKTDPDYVKTLLTRFKEKHHVSYDMVFGGIADKKVVAESLPALNNFMSFPTTLFIDKTGQVAKIHTGYTGPATGKYYEEFVVEFNREIDALLAEPAQAGSKVQQGN